MRSTCTLCATATSTSMSSQQAFEAVSIRAANSFCLLDLFIASYNDLVSIGFCRKINVGPYGEIVTQLNLIVRGDVLRLGRKRWFQIERHLSVISRYERHYLRVEFVKRKMIGWGVHFFRRDVFFLTSHHLSLCLAKKCQTAILVPRATTHFQRLRRRKRSTQC